MARRVNVSVEAEDHLVQMYSLFHAIPEDEVTDEMLAVWFAAVLDNKLNFLRDMRGIAAIANKYKPLLGGE